jgi:glycosyltransferase involved in cell wall biosynthesis
LNKQTIDLAVIIPVYNEMEIIETMIDSWKTALGKLDIRFEIRAYDDGSKDDSLEVLNKISKTVPELVVINKSNSGHGPTILQGYREANAEYTFQIDSDNEIKSEHFEKLWKLRDQYDFIIGERSYLKAPPFSRLFISKVASVVVQLFYGKGIKDVNCPFRLFRSDVFSELFSEIPATTFAPNLILSGYAAQHKLRLKNVPVSSEFRETGTVSIQQGKLLRVAVQSFLETILFSFKK